MRAAGRMIATSMAAIAAMTAASATAQDVVVMRRVIAPPTRKPTTAPTPTPTPQPTPTAGHGQYYSWTVSDWTQMGTCGQQGTETRDVKCVRTDGVVSLDADCTGDNSGPKPATSQPVVVTKGCAYDWQPGAWSAASTTCGTSSETRDVACVRSDGTVADASSCTAARPDTQRSVTDTSGCSYAWRTGAWGATTQSCGQGTQTRSVSCGRSDGSTADDAKCTGAKPETTQTVTSTATCTTAWTTGEWGNPTPACGATTASRTVTCHRSDGTDVDGSQCAGDRPASTEPSTDYTTCTDGRTAAHPYNWRVGAWSAPSSTCGVGTQTRTVQCLDDAGGAADEGKCVGGKPDASQPTSETSGCSYQWVEGIFGAPQPACGATVQTRANACRRSDGTTADPSLCTAPQPATTQPATDYGACTFQWTTSQYGPWSTSCGDATQTRTVSCQRADGTAADEAKCTTTRPDSTSPVVHQTSGCGYEWVQGGFGTPAPGCGSTTQTQTVTCRRADGVTLTGDDAKACTNALGAAPATSKTTTDTSACTFDWSYGDYSAPSTTCGDATQTRAATCRRSDTTAMGTANPDAGDVSGCVAAKGAAVTSQASHQTSGCTFYWQDGAWGAPVAACGATTRSRTVTCMRSDGTPATSPSLCTATPDASVDNTATDYSTCGYQWNVSQWSSEHLCGISSTQTRTVTCDRLNGNAVNGSGSDAQCVAGDGPQPPKSQTVTDYSGCSYSWKPSYGATAAACGASSRPISYACVRSDGTAITDPTQTNAFCGAAPTATSDTSVTDYSTCTYNWNYDAYGSPSTTCGTATQTRTTSCQRSDSTIVGTVSTTGATSSGDVSKCVAAKGQAKTTSDPFTNTTSCTYAGTYGAPYGACAPSSQGATTGSQTNTISACTRSDGADDTANNVSLGYKHCGQTSYGPCTPIYTATYSATYDACVPTSQGATTGTQTAPIATCKAGDGSTQPNAACASQTSAPRSCTPTYTGTYNWGTCVPSSAGATTGTEAGTISKCTAGDGSTQPNGSCSSTSSRTCTGIVYAENYGACTNSSQPITQCTTTAADGISGTVANNLCPSSAQTRSCAYTNLLTNGDFKATNGWTGFAFTTDSNNSGAKVGSLSSANVNVVGEGYQDVTVVAGHQYQLTFGSYLRYGAYCAVPLKWFFKVGSTVVATQSSASSGFCTGTAVSNTLTYTATASGTMRVDFTVQAQQSYSTNVYFTSAVLVDLNQQF